MTRRTPILSKASGPKALTPPVRKQAPSVTKPALHQPSSSPPPPPYSRRRRRLIAAAIRGDRRAGRGRCGRRRGEAGVDTVAGPGRRGCGRRRPSRIEGSPAGALASRSRADPPMSLSAGAGVRPHRVCHRHARNVMAWRGSRRSLCSSPPLTPPPPPPPPPRRRPARDMPMRCIKLAGARHHRSRYYCHHDRASISLGRLILLVCLFRRRRE
jgi:hypothetical protein